MNSGYVFCLGELVGVGVVVAGAPLGLGLLSFGDGLRLAGLRARVLGFFFLHASDSGGD